MNGLWVTSKEWAGQTVAVLASGPSMSLAVANAVREAGCRVIAVNNQGVATRKTDGTTVAALAPWADIMYAADQKWWHANRPEALKFKGRKVTITQNNGTMPKLIDESVYVLGNGGPYGFDPRKNYIKNGSNSGFQAVHLAITLGAKRVLMCGFDLNDTKGSHWFGDHYWRKSHNPNFKQFIRAFDSSARDMLKVAEVINCTPGSVLRCFPRMELEDALRTMRSSEIHGSEAAAGEARAPREEVGEACHG